MHTFRLGPDAVSAGYRLEGFETIGSTNAEALARARAGDPGRLWLAARAQSAGRGRRGRPWQSPVGNLAATLLLRVEPGTPHPATLGFVAGVALRSALARIFPDADMKVGLDGADSLGTAGRIALKWPNDLLADGAKLAGILLEGQAAADGSQSIAIGFGVNVVAAPEGLPYPATSLAGLGVETDAQAVFAALSSAWLEEFARWSRGAGLADVLERWRAGAAGFGAEIAVSQEGSVVRGIFETIDADGRLIVRQDNDRRIAIAAGDVHFGATASARS